MKGIDATHVFCPEFTAPVLKLINKHLKPGETGVIKTKELRSPIRVLHLCKSYDWVMKGYKQIGDEIYIKIEIPMRH